MVSTHYLEIAVQMIFMGLVTLRETDKVGDIIFMGCLLRPCKVGRIIKTNRFIVMILLGKILLKRIEKV